MLVEQYVMMVSNAALFIPPILFFWYYQWVLGVVSLGSAVASNLFHYADLLNELIYVYGSGVVLESGLFIWEVNPSTMMTFIILDYGFSNIGMIIFLILLIPKTDHKGNRLFSSISIIIYFFAMIISGSVNFKEPHQNSIKWLTPIIVAYIIILAMLYLFTYVIIEEKKIVDYYKENFNTSWLILSVGLITTGVIFWIVLQNYFVSYYLYVHAMWHFFIAAGGAAFCFSLKKNLFI